MMNMNYDEDLKTSLKIVQQLASVKPFKRPRKDYQETMNKYRINHLQKLSHMDNLNVYRLNTNVKQHSSLRDLSELKPILLKNMQVNKIHYGHYLECKTLVDPFYTVGMYLVVQDTSGDIENVMLYNYDSKSMYQQIDPGKLIPSGTRLIIKEPFLKLYACGDGEFGIRVESPSDILITGDNDFFYQSNISKTIDELIDEGNESFKKNDFHTAIRYYWEAYKRSNETSVRAILNRSACYFKLDRYYLAYKDAEQAAKLDDKCEKAYYRMGLAAYEMKKFELALENFKKFLKFTKLIDAELQLKKCQDRLNEAKTGNYDFRRLVDEAVKNQRNFFDVADFKSNKIRFDDMKSKKLGKGAFATEDIKKGELLIVCKAVASDLNKVLRKNWNELNERNDAETFLKLVYKMHSDPYLAKQVYSLNAGKDYESNDISEFSIDIARIIAIQRHNSFQIENNFATTNQEMSEFGFWLMPSYFNHSCVSNTIKIFLGDLLILYAIKDIRKNAEITMQYFSTGFIFYSCEKRSEMTKKIFDFKCYCQLCKIDREDLNIKRIEALISEISSKKAHLKRLTLNECLEDVANMKSKYEKRVDFRIGLLPALLLLAVKYSENCNYQKSAKCLEEAYEISKDIDCFHAIKALKQASVCYMACSEKYRHDWCYNTALQYFGKNTSFFEKIWEKF